MDGKMDGANFFFSLVFSFSYSFWVTIFFSHTCWEPMDAAKRPVPQLPHKKKKGNTEKKQRQQEKKGKTTGEETRKNQRKGGKKKNRNQDWIASSSMKLLHVQSLLLRQVSVCVCVCLCVCVSVSVSVSVGVCVCVCTAKMNGKPPLIVAGCTWHRWPKGLRAILPQLTSFQFHVRCFRPVRASHFWRCPTFTASHWLISFRRSTRHVCPHAECEAGWS